MVLDKLDKRRWQGVLCGSGRGLEFPSTLRTSEREVGLGRALRTIDWMRSG